MENYLSISEAISNYGKSESTIRAIVRKSVKKKGVIKHETLKNGSKKIYISATYLDSVFKQNKNDSKVSNNTLNDNTSNELIDVLKKQLEEKDKQLKEKDKQIESILERQREHNILMSQYQQKILLIEETPVKQKKWWQRR